MLAIMRSIANAVLEDPHRCFDVTPCGFNGSSSTRELSSHQSSRGIASGSETYSFCCNRPRDQLWGHRPAMGGWSGTTEAGSERRRATARLHVLMRRRTSPLPYG